MSAQEVIEQIKALPPEDRAAVVEFVRTLEPKEARTIKFMENEQAKAAGTEVVQQYKEVFQKLAQ